MSTKEKQIIHEYKYTSSYSGVICRANIDNFKYDLRKLGEINKDPKFIPFDGELAIDETCGRIVCFKKDGNGDERKDYKCLPSNIVLKDWGAF